MGEEEGAGERLQDRHSYLLTILSSSRCNEFANKTYRPMPSLSIFPSGQSSSLMLVQKVSLTETTLRRLNQFLFHKEQAETYLADKH